jgi:hypothetical protein
VLLIAIARARSSMNDLIEGRVNSFEPIARSENKVERHIRRLTARHRILASLGSRKCRRILQGLACRAFELEWRFASTDTGKLAQDRVEDLPF